MSANEVAPVLVLGLGNRLLRDDGVGLELLERVERDFGDDPRVELVDGGTQGIALVGHLPGRRAVLVLDAVALGAVPGTVHCLCDVPGCTQHGPRSAHGGNAAELFAAATLLGDVPPSVRVVGVEPAEVRTGLGVSAQVAESLARAADAARATLAVLLAPTSGERSAQACTS